MTKCLAVFVGVLSLLNFADAAEPVVKCFAEESIEYCGDWGENACDAKVKAGGSYAVDDILRIRYLIHERFTNVMCDDLSTTPNSCDPYYREVWVKVSATTATEDIEISQSAAQVLCPENCLEADTSFTGLCQEGKYDGSKCVLPDAPAGFVPREKICTAPLGFGSNDETVVKVECMSGPSCYSVQCAGEEFTTPCGDTEDDPCDGKILIGADYQVGDTLKLTYEIATAFEGDGETCNGDGNVECDPYSKSIFVIVNEGEPYAGIDFAISQSGAEQLCPANCLNQNRDTFAGICQPDTSPFDGCLEAEGTPRSLICDVSLGSDYGAVLKFECISGPSCPVEESSTAEPEEESSTAEPGDESSTAEPEEESSTAEPEEESSTAEPGDESSTAEPEEESSTAEPGDESSTAEPEEESSTAEPEPTEEGSAFALTSGAAVLYASLLVAAMQEA